MILERYLDAKYYHYELVELTDLPENYANFAYLVNSDNIVTVSEAIAIIVDNVNVCTSTPAPRGSKTPRQSIPSDPVKDKTCPVCTEESGSRVAH